MSLPGRIVLGVTIAASLKFLGPLPALLSHAGWDVHLVSNPGKQAQVMTHENLTFHAISMARKPSLAGDLRSLFLWFRLLKKLNPTIVSIGTPKAALLGIFAAWALRVPRRVYVLRGLRLETTSGPSRWLFHQLERVTAGCATHVLSVSHSLAAKYAELGLCSATKITVLGHGSSHGVDIERFSAKPREKIEAERERLGLAPGVPVLGFVGRFSRDKGAQAILATRKKLLENSIDNELLILGRVEDSSQIIEELNAQGRPVKHLGEVSNVEDFYPLMTVLLLPTKREGFPNVVLEAGAAGVPAVATSVTGAVDSILHNETGFLVELGSDEGFANTVQRLLNDTRNLARLGEAAKTRASQHFEEKKVCSTFATYYMNLIP